MPIDFRKTASNFATAIAAQLVSVLLSIITSLFVPKVLGVTEYGYWQLFIFYSSYVGVFHLGISEGVYLLNGGKTSEELDRPLIGSQLRFSLVYQALLASSIAAIGIFFTHDQERIVVICWTVLFVLLNNATYYLGYVFQAINETKLFSYSVMVDRIVFLFPLATLILLRVESFVPYIVAYAFSKGCALAYCCVKGKNIVLATQVPRRLLLAATRESISVGIKLMLANLSSLLILGFARAVIDGEWGIAVFGGVSLAISMVNFFLQFISQLSMVLFPALRRSDSGFQKKFFTTMKESLSLVLPLAYLAYFGFSLIIVFWLPSYSDTLLYLVYLMPICVFDGLMNICCSTFLKVLRKEKVLLRANVIAVVISCIGSFMGAYLIGSIELVLISALVAIIVRSLISNRCLNIYYRVSDDTSMLWIFALTIVFIGSSLIFEDVYAFAICLVCYLIYCFFYRDRIVRILGLISRHVG